MQPLKSFLDGEMKSLTVGLPRRTKSSMAYEFSLQKERRTLEMKRLDLDAARSKKKKARTTNSQVPVAMADVSRRQRNERGYSFFPKSSDTELRHAQAEFDRQLELTRLMLDGLNHSQVVIRVCECKE